MATVSIALATFNGAEFLRQQLDCLAAQTLRPTELVVCDDGSTDATLAILADFATAAPFPVRVHGNTRRLGYRANFMQALSLCTGEVVAFCDQDDIWEPMKLQCAAAAFADPDVVLFFHDVVLVDPDGAALGPADIFHLPARNPPLSYYPMRNPCGFSIVFRRSLDQFSEFWLQSMDSREAGNRMAHDQWITFLASIFGVTVCCDERLVRYRQHRGNVYGRELQGGLMSRFGSLFRDKAAEHAQLARAARERLRLIESMLAKPLKPQQQQQAQAAIGFYQQLHRRLDLRARVYTEARLQDQLRAGLQLARSGCYRRGTVWEIGPKALARDVIEGVALRKLKRRTAIRPAASTEYLRRDRPASS